MARPLKNFFFYSLPVYFKIFDADKVAGEGILERFINILEGESETSYNKAVGMEDLYNPLLIPLSHLYILGSVMGSPPTLFNLETPYRNLLNGLPSLLKVKGTVKAIEMFFKLFGASVEIIDETPPIYKYDTETRYDGTARYDTPCSRCFYISINIIDSTGILPFSDKISGKVLDELLKIIYWLIPINVFLNRIKYNSIDLSYYLLQEDGIPLMTAQGIKLKTQI